MMLRPNNISKSTKVVFISIVTVALVMTTSIVIYKKIKNGNDFKFNREINEKVILEADEDMTAYSQARTGAYYACKLTCESEDDHEFISTLIYVHRGNDFDYYTTSAHATEAVEWNKYEQTIIKFDQESNWFNVELVQSGTITDLALLKTEKLDKNDGLDPFEFIEDFDLRKQPKDYKYQFTGYPNKLLKTQTGNFKGDYDKNPLGSSYKWTHGTFNEFWMFGGGGSSGSAILNEDYKVIGIQTYTYGTPFIGSHRTDEIYKQMEVFWNTIS